jgi:hypothetical protein
VIVLIIEDEKTFFGESINTPDEFMIDLCERIDKVYNIVMDEENRALQLRYITGFIRAFKNRLNRVCERPYNKLDIKIINQKYTQIDESKLIFEGEMTFFAESINNPEEFLEDFCNRIDTVVESAMEEEDEMPRLAYLIGSLIGLKSRLNRVCGKV